jgi:hypothetical protein
MEAGSSRGSEATRPPALSISDVSETFGMTTVLDRMSLDIEPDEIHALEFDALQHALDTFDWTPAHRSVLAAADELHQLNDISDATWSALTRDLSHKQLIELA